MLAAACSSSDGGKASETDSFSVAGSVRGLLGAGLVLHNSGGGDSLAIKRQADADAGDGEVHFTFATALANGSTYGVTVATQPSAPKQTCTVSSGAGTIAGADVTNVVVSCTTETFSVGGSVTGLDQGESVVLQNNGGPEFTVSTATFVAPNTFHDGQPFEISVKVSPSGKKCAVTNGSGTVAGADVTSVAVTCIKECGNGIVDLGEACDDGNTVNIDACSNTCTRNPVYLGGTRRSYIDGALNALGEPFDPASDETTRLGDAPTAGVLISANNGDVGKYPTNYQTFLDAGGHILLIGGAETTDFRDFVGAFLNVGTSYVWHRSDNCTSDWNIGPAHPMTRLLPATYEFSVADMSYHMLHLLPTQPQGTVVLGTTCEAEDSHILAIRTYPSGGTFAYLAFTIGTYGNTQTSEEFVEPFLKGYLEYVRSKR
jgi:cysteine-rich repeat protein